MAGKTILNATAEFCSVEGGGIEDTFVNVWLYFCETVVALHKNIDWNACRVEFWSESGKIVIFPDKWPPESDVAVAVCEVVIPWFQGYARERLHSGMDVDQAAAEIEEVEQAIANQISRAAERIGLAKILGRSNVLITFCMPGDDEPFQEVEISNE